MMIGENANREFRILKEELASHCPSRATTGQCQALRSRGIFATPNTHSFERACELLDETAHLTTIPTEKQVGFAVSLGIATAGLTRNDLSTKIDEALKTRDILRAADKVIAEQNAAERAALPPAPKAKNTSVSRHAKTAVIRALAARGLTAEQIAAALETAKLDRAEFILTANRRWLDTQMADTKGKPAKLTNDDLNALGLEAQ